MRRNCKHKISIHALREEGDSTWCSLHWPVGNFYPRPPRGGRLTQDKIATLTAEFLSTPSARRATWTGQNPAETIFYFYPRPPRGGRRKREIFFRNEALFLSTPSARRATHRDVSADRYHPISIHALREEGDKIKAFSKILYSLFLSTPSARRATHRRRFPRGVVGISIHALHEEGDLFGVAEDVMDLFLSTPSARRATLPCQEHRHKKD